MARDQTDADYEYGKLLCERRRLSKVIAEAAAGAAEERFSAETRAEWARALKEDRAELARVEARIREIEPQAKKDQARRHARDMEGGKARRRKQPELKM